MPTDPIATVAPVLQPPPQLARSLGLLALCPLAHGLLLLAHLRHQSRHRIGKLLDRIGVVANARSR